MLVLSRSLTFLMLTVILIFQTHTWLQTYSTPIAIASSRSAVLSGSTGSSDFCSLPPPRTHVSLHPAQSIRERPSGSVSLLQQPRPSPRRMRPTSEYLHHPTRPPDVRCLPPHSSSRPVPIRGHGTSLLEEAPTPRISPRSCAVPEHFNWTSSTLRTFSETIVFGGQRLR